MAVLGEHHSITSSADTSSSCGTVRPSAFAVLRLMASSKFGRLEDGNVPWFRAFQNLNGHVGGAAAEGRNFDPVVHEPPASSNSPGGRFSLIARIGRPLPSEAECHRIYTTQFLPK